ncbi:hypothetical protein MXD62_33445 [Frankia sp. Mgl5]|uniref:hypothetical protein n=1 Tax=Frankia sp. Mgl5 TaxID=2933793 RepID=UPI00200D2B65|nr:hypothetical protein [Frankia sp. Mgl5]MCK9931986.1 hypothetical protein [Frankia sp. Mgl5]
MTRFLPAPPDRRRVPLRPTAALAAATTAALSVGVGFLPVSGAAVLAAYAVLLAVLHLTLAGRSVT